LNSDAERSLAAHRYPLSTFREEYVMTKLKLFTAAAVLSTLVSAPAVAEQVYHRHHHYHHYRAQVDQDRGPVGAAADVAGAAIGTAGAIATAPFGSSYNSYDHRDYYDRDMGPSGFACRPGTWIKSDDGSRHICQ
jgi:hypothetical protein